MVRRLRLLSVTNTVEEFASWRKNSRAAVLEEGVAQDGNRSVLLAADGANDVTFAQAVAVQPNTDYLLSGCRRWGRVYRISILRPSLISMLSGGTRLTLLESLALTLRKIEIL